MKNRSGPITYASLLPWTSFSLRLICFVVFVSSRLIAWPALFYAIYSFNNAQPLRTKEGSSGGISSLGSVFLLSSTALHHPLPRRRS